MKEKRIRKGHIAINREKKIQEFKMQQQTRKNKQIASD